MLGEKPANQFTLFFVADPREQLRPQLDDRLRAIKGKPLVHFSAGKMAGLATLLEDRPDFRHEIDRRSDSRAEEKEQHQEERKHASSLLLYKLSRTS